MLLLERQGKDSSLLFLPGIITTGADGRTEDCKDCQGMGTRLLLQLPQKVGIFHFQI